MERKRQRRGEQRMEALVAAAEAEFAEQGYERATTNAIAARAGVSPGTLYQFFPHKAALAEALAAKYAAAFEALHSKVLFEGIEKLPLEEFIDLVVDPFLEFHRNAPAFETLLSAGSLPQQVVELKGAFAGRLTKLFRKRRPKAKPGEMQMAAEVSIAIFDGMLPMLQQQSPALRRRAAEVLKVVLARYLAPELDA